MGVERDAGLRQACCAGFARVFLESRAVAPEERARHRGRDDQHVEQHAADDGAARHQQRGHDPAGEPGPAAWPESASPTTVSAPAASRLIAQPVGLAEGGALFVMRRRALRYP